MRRVRRHSFYPSVLAGSLLLSACFDASLPAAPDNREVVPFGIADVVPGQCVVPPDGLVSWWDADAVSGATASDIRGDNDGTLADGAATAAGKVGQAFHFNQSEVVRVSSVSEIEVQQFSVDAWVFAEAVSSTYPPLGGIIVAKDIGTTGCCPRISFNLVGPGADGRFLVDVGFEGGGEPEMVFSTNGFALNAWHHIGATWDGTSLKLYVNGQLEGTRDLSGASGYPTIAFSGEALTIGRHNLASPSRGFDGLIDEIEFFNRAISAADMHSIFAAGSAGKCKQASNSPPEVTADAPSVLFDEGQTATNTGTVSDPDADAVTLAASIGTVTDNDDGTWSWSFATSDGPAESQTVVVYADDGNGGMTEASFMLTVNNVAPTVIGVSVPAAPVGISNQPVSGTGSFSDPGAGSETHSCVVDYGDGSGPQAGTVAGTTCTGPGHTYADAGIYTVTVTVSDGDGGSHSLASETFLVIYDPSGGFVTGGGWIDSPAGAYAAEPTLAGKANFGFVSKYKKGASAPTGNTQFQFKAGDINLHSSTYDWLVVNQSGTNAQFKGWATVNGLHAPNGSEYRFMVWAGDNGADTFRIRIWYEDVGEVVVYDNGFDQPISGGSIVIHTKN